MMMKDGKLVSTKKVIKNTKKRASSTVYIIFFIVIFLTFAALAVDGALVLTNRAKLQNATETTALAAAAEFENPLTATSEFHMPKCANIAEHVKTTAENTFNLLKIDSLENATINVKTSTTSNKVLVTTNMISEPFFLTFLGVNGIKLEAKACAVSESLPVMANYPGVNWLTTNAAYLSDILSKDLNMNDTAILTPLGGGPSASYQYGYANFSLLSSEDTPARPLSLGPGGFVTIKLPAPIINKTGDDLFIKEVGALEGYMVFAGLDNDPTNPYVNVDKPGGKISWVNISCSGTSSSSALGNKAHQSANTKLTTNIQDKFYGSGRFDIGAACTGGMSMAKYIRIIDDNDESAFVTNDNTNYYKAMLYGEASTATSGADIDVVKVINHVRLIPSTKYVD